MAWHAAVASTVAAGATRLYPSSTPFIFLQPPHTGTSTVISSLAASFGCEAFDNTSHSLSKKRCPRFHSSPAALHNHAGRACNVRTSAYRPSFAFVRDPWSRVLSCAAWNDVTVPDAVSSLAEGNKSRISRFRSWVRAQFEGGGRGVCAYMRSVSDYTHCNGTLIADFVGRTARLHHDFAHVCSLLNISARECVDPAGMPRHCLNSCSTVWSHSAHDMAADAYAARHGSRLRLADAYDDHTRELVRNAWAADVALFNFTFAEAVLSDA